MLCKLETVVEECGFDPVSEEYESQREVRPADSPAARFNRAKPCSQTPDPMSGPTGKANPNLHSGGRGVAGSSQTVGVRSAVDGTAEICRASGCRPAHAHPVPGSAPCAQLGAAPLTPGSGTHPPVPLTPPPPVLTEVAPREVARSASGDSRQLGGSSEPATARAGRGCQATRALSWLLLLVLLLAKPVTPADLEPLGGAREGKAGRTEPAQVARPLECAAAPRVIFDQTPVLSRDSTGEAEIARRDAAAVGCVPCRPTPPSALLPDPARDSGGEGVCEWWRPERAWERRERVKGPRRHPASEKLRLAAARLLQHVFRRTRARWPGGWSRGAPRPAVMRPVETRTCCHGQNLAGPSDFACQAEVAADFLRWQAQYVHLLRRVESGRQPLVLDLFCGGGGSSEGVRRAGAAPMGMDDTDQPHFRVKFGTDRFILGDALDLERLRGYVRRLKPIGVIASPPCEGFSTATFAGAASRVERLIAVTRDTLEAIGLPYVIENVLGARSEIREHAIIVRGQDFGLRTERPRFLESGGGFRLQLETALASGGSRLRRRCCLGARNRYGTLDLFGMPQRVPCCEGNTFSVMGRAPYMCTEAQEAASMGLDPGHMPHPRMAKALPPAYMEYVTGQMAMHVLRERHGLQVIPYSEKLAEPERCTRALRHLIRGAGGTSPSLGLQLAPLRASRGGGERPPVAKVEWSATVAHVDSCPPDRSWMRGEVGWYSPREGQPIRVRVTAVDEASRAVGEILAVTVSGEDGSSLGQRDTIASRLSRSPPSACSPRAPCEATWSLSETAFRELDYTHVGDFDSTWLAPRRVNWLEPLRPHERVSRPLEAASWRGRNTFVHAHPELVGKALPAMSEALREAYSGTRVSVLLSELSLRDSDLGGRLSRAGFTVAHVVRASEGRAVGWDGELLCLPCDLRLFSCGERECCVEGAWLDHDSIAHEMDPRDRGGYCGPPGRKAAISWTPLERDPSRWVGKGLPPEVEDMMVNGITIDPIEGEVGAVLREESQYSWVDSEHFFRGTVECDRAIVAGHLELVPEEEAEWSLEHGTVHPWTVVHQSEEKWRACQDYSVGTNRRSITAPFALPRAQDVAPLLVAPVAGVEGSGTHFGSRDLRDGFWCTTIRRECRHHLMVSHPSTGRLLRCTSLPFGYSRSPELFCSITEGVARVFRRRVAGMGIHILSYVDDLLVFGDDREGTVHGLRVLDELLKELGLPWAPHKMRGPCRAIEFLGVLLVNTSDRQCIALTEKRQHKLVDMVGGWLARRPSRGEGTAGPRELAQLLGHLVFASEVVPGGRTFMQTMLRQFRGLHVDWLRGTVRHVGGAPGPVQLLGGFWRDLLWWKSALGRANSSPLQPSPAGELAIVGSDASDFACGELVWLDGAREETRLVFTHAERRRPINFRELRGSLRVLEVFGERLRGRTVLVELDNTCAYEVTRRFFSKQEDLQELARRILHRAQKHGIRVRACHTPGAMLHRPDQTSRGDSPEEPRVRLRRSVFDALAARYGPFTSFLGAEREHAESSRTAVKAEGPPRLWLHPTFTTSASALRLVGEQLSGSASTCARGLILLPFAPEAPWWRLTRHLVPIGRLGEGGGHLEENRLGRWVPVTSRRDSVVFSFPRAAGTRSVQLLDLLTVRWAEGGEASLAERGLVGISQHAPLPRGALLYSPPYPIYDGDGIEQPGCVYLLLEQFDGVGRPACAHLHDGGSDAAARRFRAGKPDLLRLDARSLTPDGQPWRPELASLWVASHLGEPVVGAEASLPLALPSRAARWRFDLHRATEEVRAGRRVRGEVEQGERESSLGLERAIADLSLQSEATLASDPDDSLEPLSRYAERRECGGGDGWAPSPAVPTSPAPVSTPVPVVAASPRRLRTPAPAEPGLAVTRCASTIRCAACARPIAESTFACRLGTVLVHNSMRCVTRQRARREVAEASVPAVGAPTAAPEKASPPGECPPCIDEATSEPVLPPGAVPRTGSDQRRVQLAASISLGRRLRVRACLAGTCGVEGEEQMECLSCDARLHGVSCAEISRGFASVGCFTCTRCLIGKAVPDLEGEPPEPLREMAESKMLTSLTVGAEATGGGFADLTKLLAGFRESLGVLVGRLVSPLDDPGVFQMFLLWLVVKKERALSLDTVWRSAGSLMGRTGRPNLTKSAEVKAYYENLRELHGEESHPRTALTRRMVRLLFDSVLEKFIGKSLLLKRTRLFLALEVMMGLRVGEVLGGGDGHGLLANNLVILRNLTTGEESVEALIEHSKTKHRRWVTAVGLSEGEARVPLAQCVREYWEEGGFSVGTWHEGGYAVTGTDYSVVRVSLIGLGETDLRAKARLEQLFAVLARSKSEETRQHATTSKTKGMERFSLTSSTDRRYVNVVGGRAGRDVILDDGTKVRRGMDKCLVTVVDELARAGFDEPDRVTIVPGPLIRASSHVGRVQTHMPLVASSTYEGLHTWLEEAQRLANLGGPDPELDLQGLAEPLWGHHSSRRFADTVARQTMAETGATEQDIDLTFGWQEAMYSARMQVHYESKFVREKRKAVTRLI